MSRLFAAIYDPFMKRTERATFAAWRRELLAHAEGKVLEIGAGTGANVPYYERAEHVVLAEPDLHMRKRLAVRAAGDGRFEVTGARADRLPFESGRFDSVVITLVLCSVPDVDVALGEVRRVLKPGGRLVFLEHVASGEPGMEAWQRRLDPVWSRIVGNCHLTRRTHEDIERAGFTFDVLERDRAKAALSIVKDTVRGVARY